MFARVAVCGRDLNVWGSRLGIKVLLSAPYAVRTKPIRSDIRLRAVESHQRKKRAEIGPEKERGTEKGARERKEHYNHCVAVVL